MYPGKKMFPIFALEKVTVKLQLVATPIISPVSEFTPLGISIAIIGTLEELILLIIDFSIPVIFLDIPMPNIASTMRSKFLIFKSLKF